MLMIPKKGIGDNNFIKIVLGLITILCIFMGLSYGIHQLKSINSIGFDFHCYWSTSLAFLDGKNPYSVEVAIQNQIGAYGHIASPSQDPLFFRNPIYSILIILPFSFLSYDWAYSIWISFNILVLLTVCFISFPSLPKWMIGLFIFFYQISFGILYGNFTIISASALLLFIGVILYQENHHRNTQIIVGLLLSFSTFKPQLSWLFIIWILFYSIRHHLHYLLATFILTVTFTSIIFLFFAPEWPKDFYQLIFSYQDAVNVLGVRKSLFNELLSPATAMIIGSIFLLLSLLVTAYFLIFTKTKIGNLYQLIFVGLSTYLAHPSGYSNEQICLFIPVIAWLILDITPKFTRNLVWIVLFVSSYLFYFYENSVFWSGIILWGPLAIYIVWIMLILITCPWTHWRERSSLKAL